MKTIVYYNSRSAIGEAQNNQENNGFLKVI